MLRDLITLSDLILSFGQTFRITQDANGNLESDTTHTVMLALMAASLAPKESVPLDVALVIKFALVHDLPEAIVGDTPTLKALTPEQQAEKDSREEFAIDEIYARTLAFPWITEAILEYNRQDTHEARFVKYIDKILPKLSHLQNGFVVARASGVTRHELIARHKKQGEWLGSKYPELSLARQLFDAACQKCEQEWPIISQRADCPQSGE